MKSVALLRIATSMDADRKAVTVIVKTFNLRVSAAGLSSSDLSKTIFKHPSQKILGCLRKYTGVEGRWP